MEANEVKAVEAVEAVKAVNTVNPDDFRNKQTAVQLMRAEGAGLDFYPAKKQGNLRFVCGTKAGYVSHNISKKLAEDPDSVEVEDMRYAEIRATKDNKEVWIPTLFLASVKFKPVKHFSLK